MNAPVKNMASANADEAATATDRDIIMEFAKVSLKLNNNDSSPASAHRSIVSQASATILELGIYRIYVETTRCFNTMIFLFLIQFHII